MTAGEQATDELVAARDRLVRHVRRVCALRELGRRAEANDLERREFAGLVAAARAEDAIDAIVAREGARAADATVLADLVVARLRGHSPDQAGDIPPAHPEVAAAPSRPAPGENQIADFLDAMLALERAAPRRPLARTLNQNPGEK